MSGILAVIGRGKDPQFVKELSKRMSHRGSDNNAIHIMENGSLLSHESLAVIDLETGAQPMQGSKNAWMIHDGEIYNYRQLKEGVLKTHNFRTKSDSEVIVHLYEEFGYDFCNMLDGAWSFVVMNGDDYIAGRDPIGVKPFYYGLDERGRIYFSSEMKAIADQCKSFSTFPPGHYYTAKTGFVKYYEPDYENFENANRPLDLELIRTSLTRAVNKRLMSEVPVGVILSGGLDSSLISAIAGRALKEKNTKIHSFSIGLNADSPDNKAARIAAEFLGTEHHEVHFTIEQGIAALEKVIYHIETYDIISVRAGVPMYLLAEVMAQLGIKVILSGEGADEVFGGHLYFRNAPSVEAFQEETIERVQKIFTADLLRADKTTMAHGVEARFPFLDKDFLDAAILIKTCEKLPKTYDGIEKYILRKAFDTPENAYLPSEILWRQKEQFSDGVGYNWIDELIEYCTSNVTDEQLSAAATEFPYNTTKEAYLYRFIFHKFYPQTSAAQTVRKWIPKWQDNPDPSGRANTAHFGRDLAISKSIEV
jgi:asparagine synthase (glutamine-hydrolysing)